MLCLCYKLCYILKSSYSLGFSPLIKLQIQENHIIISLPQILKQQKQRCSENFTSTATWSWIWEVSWFSYARWWHFTFEICFIVKVFKGETEFIPPTTVLISHETPSTLISWVLVHYLKVVIEFHMLIWAPFLLSIFQYHFPTLVCYFIY